MTLIMPVVSIFLLHYPELRASLQLGSRVDGLGGSGVQDLREGFGVWGLRVFLARVLFRKLEPSAEEPASIPLRS